MSASLNSPDHSRAPLFDQSIIEFVSPFVSSAYRRIRRNQYPTPSATLAGNISQLNRNVGKFSLDTDQEFLLKNGVTFEQLEQRRRAVKYLERVPKPKRHHIRNDGTLALSKRPQEEIEEHDEGFLKGTIKPKKVCPDKEQVVLDASDFIDASKSYIRSDNIVGDDGVNVLDVTLDESSSSLVDSSELDELHDVLDESKSDLIDLIDLVS